MKYALKLAILLPFLLWSCGGSKTEESIPELIRPVKYQEVGVSGGKNTFSFSGIAQSGQEARLSFRVSGTIRSLNVKLGDRVRRGQVIATIDPSDYTIQAEQATASKKGSDASLKSSETQLIIARTNYERIEKLYESNSVPLSEFEQAKSNYETAQSSYEAAKTQVTSTEKQVEAAKNQVNYTRLTAPFNGVITTVNAEANEVIGSGSPVAVLSSEAEPEVQVGVPENLISNVKKGQKVAIRFSALEDQTFEGVVQEVSYAAGTSPTYPAVIRIKNASDDIRPGMASTVTFNFGKADEKQFTVSPIEAIGEDSDGNFAFLLQKTDQSLYVVKKQTVEVGALLPDGFEIKSGLKPGDLVATAGLSTLLDSMKVKLITQ